MWHTQMVMKNKQNLWIGIGVVIIIAALVLIITLSKKKETAPTVVENTLTTETVSAPKVQKNTSVKKVGFITPQTGSTIARSTTTTVSWNGDVGCYDLSYVFNPGTNTNYNFIGKICENTNGLFNYQWPVPTNTQPGTYGLRVTKSGSENVGAMNVVFVIK